MIIKLECQLDCTTKKVTIETSAETIYEVVEEIRGALLAYGFSPTVVDDGFLGMAEIIENERKDENKR